MKASCHLNLAVAARRFAGVAAVLVVFSAPAGEPIVFSEPGKSSSVPKPAALDTGDGSFGRVQMSLPADLSSGIYTLPTSTPVRKPKKTDDSSDAGFSGFDRGQLKNRPVGFEAFEDGSAKNENNLDSYFRNRERKKQSEARDRNLPDRNPADERLLGPTSPQDNLRLQSARMADPTPNGMPDNAPGRNMGMDPRNRGGFGANIPNGPSMGDTLMDLHQRRVEEERHKATMDNFRQMIDFSGNAASARSDLSSFSGDLTRQASEPVMARAPETIMGGPARTMQNPFNAQNSGFGGAPTDGGLRPFGGINLPNSFTPPETKRFEASPGKLPMPRRQF